MKQLVILGMTLLAGTVAFAQSEMVKIIRKSDVPEVVVNTVEEDYPNADLVEWYSVPELIDFDNWKVATYRDAYFKDHKPDRYAVMLKTNDSKEILIYDKDGKLISSKETVVDGQLPITIKNELAKDKYKNWTVVGDKEKIRMGDTDKEYYRVKLSKGNKTKYVYFDLVGNTFHERSKIL